jgi:hypothetical protein
MKTTIAITNSPWSRVLQVSAQIKERTSQLIVSRLRGHHITVNLASWCGTTHEKQTEIALTRWAALRVAINLIALALSPGTKR